jgi:hypothetical protein
MSNETKKTALDILINTFKENIRFLESNLEDATDPTTRIQLTARLSQARYFLNYANESKEKEKEQIEDAFYQGENNSVDYFNPENRIKESEQYYNETYGGNK